MSCDDDVDMRAERMQGGKCSVVADAFQPGQKRSGNKLRQDVGEGGDTGKRRKRKVSEVKGNLQI